MYCIICKQYSHTTNNCFKNKAKKSGIKRKNECEDSLGRTIPSKKIVKVCERCGRDSHKAKECYATKHVNGCTIEEEDEEDVCKRCGRDSHKAKECYATKHVKGFTIEDEEDIPESGVYVLKLSGGNYYVGKSKDIEKRMGSHLSGKGAAWTKKHEIVGKCELITNSMDDLDSWERAETLELAKKYGIEKVRGYKWTRVEIPVDEEKDFVTNIRERNDLCRKCGSSNHMISRCLSKENHHIY